MVTRVGQSHSGFQVPQLKQAGQFFLLQRQTYALSSLSRSDLEESMADLQQAVDRVGFRPIALCFRLCPAYFKYEHTYDGQYGVFTIQYLKNPALVDLIGRAYQGLGEQNFARVLKTINDSNATERVINGNPLVDSDARVFRAIFETILTDGIHVFDSLPGTINIYRLPSFAQLLKRVGEKHKAEAIQLLKQIMMDFQFQYSLRPMRKPLNYGNARQMFRDLILTQNRGIQELRMTARALQDGGIGYESVYECLDLMCPEFLDLWIKHCRQVSPDAGTRHFKARFFGPAETDRDLLGPNWGEFGVQGVGFREFCDRLMEIIGIGGEAINLGDDSVEVEVTGSPYRVALFQVALTPNRENPFLQARNHQFYGCPYLFIGLVEPKTEI